MKRQDLKWYLAGSVALMTFVVYLASLQNGFVEWDDSQYVFENLHIRSFDFALIRWAFFHFYAAGWHPLTWISHALDYAIWGLNPLGHHLTSSILHAANAFLVVLLVMRLLSGVNLRPSRDSRFTIHDSPFTLTAAATTGLLFGLHPLHVESVAWVAERKDLLCALFFLLTVIMYTVYMRQRTYRSYLLTLSFFMLALLSKPMAVSLPFVLFILDWYPFGRITSLKTFRSSFIEKIPFLALSIVTSVLTIMAQEAGGAMAVVEVIPVSWRVPVAAKALIVYLWKMIVPLHLIPYYPYPKDVSLFSLEYLSAIVLAVLITAACIVMARKQKLLFAVWAFYVVTLIPVLGLIQVGGQSMADRYTYLPSLGPFLMMGLLIAWISDKTHGRTPAIKYLSAATAVFLLLLLSFLTLKQVEVWKSSLTLWTYVIEKEPNKVPIAHNNRGRAFYGMGRLDEAIQDFNKAIILDPLSFKAYLNRGAACVSKGLLDQALSDFDEAIALNPSYSEAYNAKGSLLGMSGSLEKAIEQFNRAIELNPEYAAAYGNRGSAYSLIGENGRALEDLDKAIQLDQYYARNYLNRGNLHLATGNKELAISDFRRACDLGGEDGCNALTAIRK